MRLKKRKTKTAETKTSVTKTPGWMITDPTEQKQAFQSQSALSGANRPPETWLADGDEKVFRLRDPIPVCIYRYTLQIGGKFQQFTAPDNDEVDLFRDELGLTPTLKAVYEVIDLTGYFDKKKNKQVTEVARFFVVSSRLHEQLKTIAKKRGPLNSYNIEFSRRGSGTSTTYTALPEPASPMKPQWKSLARLKDDFAKYYGPPSPAIQRMIVQRVSGSVGDDD